jgi:fatty acid desaturase
MLRFRADRRTLAFVFAFYCIALGEWLALPLRAAFAVPFVIGTASVAWICAVIAHNALHCPVFEGRSANRVFHVALSCAYGFPVSEYVPGHNLSHHKHTQKPADLMRTSKARFLRINLINAFTFFPAVAADILFQNYRYVRLAKKSSPAWHRQLMLELCCCWGSKALLLTLDWKRAVLFVLIPQLWAVYGITTVNFLQHDGCDEDHPFDHSRNFVGVMHNWFTFNNGFHGVHHLEPGLHWSLLREAHHDRVSPHLHPALEQKSLLGYLWRTFISPGTRARYDGAPLNLPRACPDEEWIPKNIRFGAASEAAAPEQL